MSRVALTFNLVYFLHFCGKIAVKNITFLCKANTVCLRSVTVQTAFCWCSLRHNSICLGFCCIKRVPGGRRKPRFRIILLLLNHVVSLSENNLAEQLTLTSSLWQYRSWLITHGVTTSFFFPKHVADWTASVAPVRCCNRGRYECLLWLWCLLSNVPCRYFHALTLWETTVVISDSHGVCYTPAATLLSTVFHMPHLVVVLHFYISCSCAILYTVWHRLITFRNSVQ